MARHTNIDRRESFEDILGIRLSRLTRAQTVDELVLMLDQRQVRWFACVNPHSVVTASRDVEFLTALQNCDLCTADGVGIVLASRILGGGIRERVCGPDLFMCLCERLNLERPGTRMFFLGTTEDTLMELVRRFRRDFPNLVIVGTLAPPFRSSFSAEDEHRIVNAVNATNPDILWIGMGAPKQEKLTYRLRGRLNVRLIGPIGGVFDFYAGRVRLPPGWAQQAGLIWLYRFCQQPRRLFRRNLDSPIFLYRILKQRRRCAKDNADKESDI